MRATAGELRNRNIQAVEKIKTLRGREKERERWQTFKAKIKPDADKTKMEQKIIEMSINGASVREIRKEVRGDIGWIQQTLMNARRRGVC